MSRKQSYSSQIDYLSLARSHQMDFTSALIMKRKLSKCSNLLKSMKASWEVGTFQKKLWLPWPNKRVNLVEWTPLDPSRLYKSSKNQIRTKITGSKATPKKTTKVMKNLSKTWSRNKKS